MTDTNETDERNSEDTDGGEAADHDRRLVEGWQGRYFEDFTVGDVYKHPYGRTVTETDNVWFTNVTMNANPMHFNEAYAAETEFGERLVDGRSSSRSWWA
jgi:acyl dehydratase